ncbi:MAG: adenosine deaminase [Pseudomonadota bacterium]|nr:adenosine deaminase [Pseudomonadota bacterium]
MTASEDFILGLPKAELHVHMEGTVTARQKWDMAKRNGVELPFDSYEHLLAEQDYTADNPADVLKKFLDLYYGNHVVFRTEQDYRDVMYEYLRRCHEGNVRYAELFFGPQGHLALGMPLETLIEGLRAGIEDGYRDFGVEAKLLLTMNRGRSAESGLETVKSLVPYKDLVVGIGMGGYEPGNPPVKMQEAFDFARSEGWKITCHCDVDQADSVKHIWQCLNDIKVDRIDHGFNVMDDPKLVEAVIEREIYLTSCPTWWNEGGNPYRMERLRGMYDAGLPLTLNSDDPGMMASGMLHELLPRVAETCQFTEAEMAKLAKNSFSAAWIDADKRARFHAEVDGWLAASAA